MKRTLLLALSLLLVGSVGLDAQQAIDLSELVAEGMSPGETGLYLDRKTFEPYTGPVVELHEDGKAVKTRGNLKDGKWDGVLRTYHESGQILQTSSFKNGLRHGPYRTLFWFGNVVGYGRPSQGVRGGTYNMGEMCGEWTIGSAFIGEAKTYDPCPPGVEDGN